MNVDTDIMPGNLLSKNDPPPVDILNAHSDHPLLLICEHAGQAIPERLDGLGISRADLDTHIGWDIGAMAVTQAMAQTLGAPAVFQRYSRLVIDCNRPPDASDAMPEVSDGVDIPGNRGLGRKARDARRQEIFDPFHDAVATCFAQHPRRMVLSIHSFTPVMDGISRPWEIGFLFRKDTETSRHLERFVRAAQPNLIIGMNRPYQIDDRSDWFVPHHGEARGLPHSLIEIRNDLIQKPEGHKEWANTLVEAATRYLEEI